MSMFRGLTFSTTSLFTPWYNIIYFHRVSHDVLFHPLTYYYTPSSLSSRRFDLQPMPLRSNESANQEKEEQEKEKQEGEELEEDR